MHLWEARHPYYMAEGCFHCHGQHYVFDSLDDFLASGWGDSDPDLNCVLRWDWSEHSPEDSHLPQWSGDDTARTGRLQIHFILQRKADIHSVEIAIARADEPRVRAWLAMRAEVMRALWSPLLCDPSTSSGA